MVVVSLNRVFDFSFPIVEDIFLFIGWCFFIVFSLNHRRYILAY